MRRPVVAATVIMFGSLLAMAGPAHAGGGCHDPTPTEASGTTVEMRDRCFQPTVLHVEPGTTVTFANRDDLEHVVSGVGFKDWPTLASGVSTKRRYDEPGTHTYMCHLHPGMTGAVVVGRPALASSARTAAEPEDSGGGITLLPLALTLAAGAVGGVVIGGRRVTSGG